MLVIFEMLWVFVLCVAMIGYGARAIVRKTMTIGFGIGRGGNSSKLLDINLKGNLGRISGVVLTTCGASLFVLALLTLLFGVISHDNLVTVATVLATLMVFGLLVVGGLQQLFATAADLGRNLGGHSDDSLDR